MRMATPNSKCIIFVVIVNTVQSFSRIFFFFFLEHAFESEGGMFPYTNIDMNPSVYLAFSCERLSMVMSLHPLSHICSDSWLQEVLIVLINARWPNDIFFPLLVTDMLCFLSWSSHESFLYGVPSTPKKGDIFAGTPFSGSFLLAFFWSRPLSQHHN